MARITFRPDQETEAIIQRAQRESGLIPSEICRIAICAWVPKQKREALVEANLNQRVRANKRKRRAAK